MVIGYNPKEDYCTCSPEGFFGVNHNYACYLHDRQYRNEVKNRLTRKGADKLLRDRILVEYIKKNKPKIGWVVSRVYYYAVRLIGWKVWEK